MEKSKIKTVWDLTSLFSSDDDPKMAEEKQEIEKSSYEFINKWKDREDYLKEPKILAEAVLEYEAWARKCGLYGKQGYYFQLRMAKDQASPVLKASMNKIIDFATKIENDIQFFELRIARISEKEQQKFLKAKELAEFRHWLERLFVSAKYHLSEAEEKVINLKVMPAHEEWERMTAGLISKEEREIEGQAKNFSEILGLVNDRDKKRRDAAAAAMNDILSRWVEVGEAEINAIMGNKKTDDMLRGFDRPDAARHLSDDTPSGVIDAMTEAVSGRWDVPARFYEIKAKLLGLPKLAYHERAVPYGKVEKKYSFEESVELVDKVFKKLDAHFSEIFLSFVEKGQVDAFPAKGKRGGAFCISDLITAPAYVLLNHTDKLENVTTIAHEFGHAINDELMREKQNALNFHTVLSTAEVASTFMEDFVFEELLREADDELRLTLMMMKLDEDMGAIFRQVAMYRFEQEMHTKFREKGYLAKEEIGKLWSDHAIASMGPAVESTPGSENWWLYVPHIRTFFYVYSYASGLLISKSLQAGVKQDPKFILKVKDFLAAGTSDSPKNIFLKLGIDISDPNFWSKGISQVEKLLSDTESLARKMGKI